MPPQYQQGSPDSFPREGSFFLPSIPRGRRRRGVIGSINRLGQARGHNAQEAIGRALGVLRDDFAAPIIIIPSMPGDLRDGRGIDFEIKGMRPLNVQVGIDVKSSQVGAQSYIDKQEELEQDGIRNPFPRFPFVFSHQPYSQLLLELVAFILEHSQSHSHQVQRLDPRSSSWNGQEFDNNFRFFLADLFKN